MPKIAKFCANTIYVNGKSPTLNNKKKPLLMGKKEGKNNIKIMKKIRCCLLFVRLTLQI